MIGFNFIAIVVISIIVLISIILYLYAHVNQMFSHLKYLITRIRFTNSLISYNRVYLLDENGQFYKIEIKEYATPIYFTYKSYYYFGKMNVLSNYMNIYSFIMHTQIIDGNINKECNVLGKYYELNEFSAFGMIQFMNKLDNDYKRIKNLENYISASSNSSLNLKF